MKAAAASKRVAAEAAPAQSAAPQADQYAALALERIHDEHLIEPERDSARFYVEQALTPTGAARSRRSSSSRCGCSPRPAAPSTGATSRARRAGSKRRPAWRRRTTSSLRRARFGAPRGGRDAEQLLKSADRASADDRLIEPANDNAKYYLLALRSSTRKRGARADSREDLGTRLVAKGRAALTLQQYDAARSWLDDAAAIGYASPQANAARHDLDAALAQPSVPGERGQRDQLTWSSRCSRHIRARPNRTESRDGSSWISPSPTAARSRTWRCTPQIRRGVRGSGDRRALLQWRYKPRVRDAKPVATARADPDSLRAALSQAASSGRALRALARSARRSPAASAPISAPMRRSSAAPKACLRISPCRSISTRLGVPRMLYRSMVCGIGPAALALSSAIGNFSRYS